MKALILASTLVLAGCATNPVKVYQGVPSTCTGVVQELHRLGEKDRKVYTARKVKNGAITSLGFAAAAGLVPAGWAWTALAAAFLSDFRLPTHGKRIEHLARVYEIRHCEGEVKL